MVSEKISYVENCRFCANEIEFPNYISMETAKNLRTKRLICKTCSRIIIDLVKSEEVESDGE